MTKQGTDTAPDNPSATTSADPTLTKRASQVLDEELTRYQTDELKRRFQNTFGVANFLPYAAAGLGGSVAVLMLLWAALILPRATAATAALSFVYMGLQGLFVGVIAAALLIVARLFQQIGAIVDITIQTLREALRDIRRLSEPARRAELSSALIHGAVVPAIKSAVTLKMGLLRAPIGFVINRLLEKTATGLTDGIKAKLLDDDADPELLDEPPEDTGQMQPADADDDSHLARMHQRIDLIARRTRRATLIPAALLFTAVAVISSVPWIAVLLTLL